MIAKQKGNKAIAILGVLEKRARGACFSLDRLKNHPLGVVRVEYSNRLLEETKEISMT